LRRTLLKGSGSSCMHHSGSNVETVGTAMNVPLHRGMAAVNTPSQGRLLDRAGIAQLKIARRKLVEHACVHREVACSRTLPIVHANPCAAPSLQRSTVHPYKDRSMERMAGT
jgi:hypothetical protein